MSDIIDRLNDEVNYVDAIDDAIRIIARQREALEKIFEAAMGGGNRSSYEAIDFIIREAKEALKEK